MGPNPGNDMRGGPGNGPFPGPGGPRGGGMGGRFDHNNFQDQTTFSVPADKCGLVIGKGESDFKCDILRKKYLQGLC